MIAESRAHLEAIIQELQQFIIDAESWNENGGGHEPFDYELESRVLEMAIKLRGVTDDDEFKRKRIEFSAAVVQLAEELGAAK